MQPTPDDPPRHGARRPGWRRGVAAAGGAVVAVALALGAAQWVRAGDDAACDAAAPPLRVAAAPEIVDVVAEVAAGADADPCSDPVVTSAEPLSVAGAVAAGQEPAPDLWIPDSSVWLSRPGLPDLVAAGSLARSPLVLAVPADLARGLGWPERPLALQELLPPPGATSGPVRWTLPEPTSSPASVAALEALRSALGGPDGGVTLASVLRASDRPGVVAARQLLEEVRDQSPRAVPVSEQAVYAHNAADPTADVAAAYLPEPAPALDYPVVVLAEDAGRRAAADALFTALTSSRTTGLLQAAGFRAPDGTAGPQLTSVNGVDPRRPGAGPLVDAAALDAATQTLTTVTLPTRLLSVIDISGSMARPAEGGGGASRLEVAMDASRAGLGLYADDTEIGLWVFSTDLTPTSDHREVVPVVRLGQGPDGTSGRDRLARGLADVAVLPDGDTGLYDTALAAVRQMRATWAPGRANAVVLLTDGRDEDDDSPPLPQVVETLRAEADPVRPVPLYTIAYGPDTDREALAQLSAATGGTTYAVSTPEQVRGVLLDAISRRPAAGSPA